MLAGEQTAPPDSPYRKDEVSARLTTEGNDGFPTQAGSQIPRPDPISNLNYPRGPLPLEEPQPYLF